MKKYFILVFTSICVLSAVNSVLAHSGRTDSSGGHNCSEKSKKKGLCTGYHSHRKK